MPTMITNLGLAGAVAAASLLLGASVPTLLGGHDVAPATSAPSVAVPAAPTRNELVTLASIEALGGSSVIEEHTQIASSGALEAAPATEASSSAVEAPAPATDPTPNAVPSTPTAASIRTPVAATPAATVSASPAQNRQACSLFAIAEVESVLTVRGLSALADPNGLRIDMCIWQQVHSTSVNGPSLAAAVNSAAGKTLPTNPATTISGQLATVELIAGSRHIVLLTQSDDAARIQRLERLATSLLQRLGGVPSGQAPSSAPSVALPPVAGPPAPPVLPTPTAAAVPAAPAPAPVVVTPAPTPAPVVATPAPTPAPPVVPPTHTVTLVSTDADGFVSYVTTGFGPLASFDEMSLPGNFHVNWFFDTTASANAGSNGPQPGDYYPYWEDSESGVLTVFDVPTGATQYCAIVADYLDRVVPGTESCIAIP